jgi:hypothetical protein
MGAVFSMVVVFVSALTSLPVSFSRSRWQSSDNKPIPDFTLTSPTIAVPSEDFGEDFTTDYTSLTSKISGGMISTPGFTLESTSVVSPVCVMASSGSSTLSSPSSLFLLW